MMMKILDGDKEDENNANTNIGNRKIKRVTKQLT